jgi:hypothetical protein
MHVSSILPLASLPRETSANCVTQNQVDPGWLQETAKVDQERDAVRLIRTSASVEDLSRYSLELHIYDLQGRFIGYYEPSHTYEVVITVCSHL